MMLLWLKVIRLNCNGVLDSIAAKKSVVLIGELRQYTVSANTNLRGVENASYKSLKTAQWS